MATATKTHKHSAVSTRVPLSLDYPRQDETITGRHYAIRVGAPLDAQKVEVAIDQGDWQACRQSAGYWWFDWTGYENGEHEITARLVTGTGRNVSAEPHEVFVVLGN